MSRIGKKPITIPAGVEVNVNGSDIKVKGAKGELDFTCNAAMTVEVKDNEVIIERPSDSKLHKTLHGTTRAIINNMVSGVSEGFKKVLLINGVGYRAQLQGTQLTVNAGYSHPVVMDVPAGLQLELPKNTEIQISGIDKQLVGQFAAEIRAIRPPEPYKGKGIKYADEIIRRKEGKKAK